MAILFLLQSSLLQTEIIRIIKKHQFSTADSFFYIPCQSF